MALLLGCAAEAPTGIVVEVDTDLLVPAEIEALRISVQDDQGVALHDRTVDLRQGGPEAALPGRLALRPDDPDDSPALAIQAIALRGSEEVVRAEARLGFRRGAVVLLRLPLLAGCRCQSCGDGNTCGAGSGCVPVARDVDALPLYQPRGSAEPRVSRPNNPCGEPTDGPSPEDGGATEPTADAAQPGADVSVAAADAGSDARDAARDLAPPTDTTTLLHTGAACSTSAQCASRACIDGFCCAGACASPCLACARALTGMADGICAPTSAGTDPHNDCAAELPGSCRYDGTCDGSGACRLYGSTTLCASPSCSGGGYFAAARCTGTGACAQAPSQPCGLFSCSVSQGCLTACQSDGDCTAGAYCSAPACVPKKANGEPCNVPGECASNSCPNKRCVGN